MISCHQHDYIEIACMYRLPLVLMFKNGSTLECVAKDTLRNKQAQECLLVAHEGTESVLVLEELLSMRVSVENPHFQLVEFGNESCDTK